MSRAATEDDSVYRLYYDFTQSVARLQGHQVTPDRTMIKADGQDLSHIAIQLYDEDGKPVQTDDKELTVTVEGDGRFLGIDNGDLRRKNSFSGNRLKTYFGKALVVVQSLRKAGTMTVSVEMEGKATPYVVTIQSAR